MKKTRTPHFHSAVQAKTARFPEDRHVLTPSQREIPNPAVALALLPDPPRPATASPAMPAPAPTVREDLQAVRRRPIDAPMATRPGDLPDPFAQQTWALIADALVEPALTVWERVKLPVAFTVWSVACFCLGMLV